MRGALFAGGQMTIFPQKSLSPTNFPNCFCPKTQLAVNQRYLCCPNYGKHLYKQFKKPFSTDSFALLHNHAPFFSRDFWEISL